MNKEMYRQKIQVTDELQKAQDHLAHQTEMYNSIVQEAYEALCDEIFQYNKNSLSARAFALRVTNSLRMECQTLRDNDNDPERLGIAEAGYEWWSEIKEFSQSMPVRPEPAEMSCASWTSLRDAPPMNPNPKVTDE